MIRAWANRVIVAIALVLALPAVTVAASIDRRRGRAVARHSIWLLSRICGVRFRVHGSHLVHPGSAYVFVANHASPLDIPAMLLAREDVTFLAADELFRNPLLAAAMRALDTRPINRRDARVALGQLRDLAREPRLCVAIFPEGGIVPAGDHVPFKSGAFAVAIEAGAAVVPVAIRGAGDVLPRGARFAVRPGVVDIEILPPIPTAGLGARDRGRLRDQAEAAVRRALADVP